MRNLEAKFRLDDLCAARDSARALGYVTKASFPQRDTFFRVPSGKLKLREQPPEAWLIHYDREKADGLMLSRYDIVPIPHPAQTRAVLARALGVLAEVRKSRELLLRRNLRLHLDRVDSLGSFGEIEAVLSAAGDEDESFGLNAAAADIQELLKILRVSEEALVNLSYFELMTGKRKR